MNRKLVIISVVLILVLSGSIVYAQQNGYFINITNSNADLNTSISNSSVIENVTLNNGTLNLHVNADNVSTVTINGVNYTAQQTPPGTVSNAPEVIVSYYGMNVGPQGVLQFASMLQEGIAVQNYTNVICYTWNITMVNLNVNQPPGGPEVNQVLATLIPDNPQLIVENSPTNQTSSQTLWHICGAFGGNYAKSCLGLYADAPLTSNQIAQITQDLQAQLPQVLINWYS